MANARKILDDDPETAQLKAAVEEARRAVKAGEVIPHDQVREWLLDLAQGKRRPPPQG